MSTQQWTSDGGNASDIAGATGLASTPQAAREVIYFDPSLGASAQNHYKTYAEVDAAAVSLAGFPVTIVFIGACIIPSGGPYRATDVSWETDFSTPGTVAIASGASFTGIPRSIGRYLTVTNSAAKPFTAASGLNLMSACDVSQVAASGASLEMFDVPSGAFFVVFASGGARFGGGGYDVCSVASGGTLVFSVVGGGASLEEDSVSGAGTVRADGNNPAAQISETQTNHTGTFEYGWNGGGSALVAYDNTSSGLTADDVESAIDELAERHAYSVDDVSDPPTDAELDSAFGDPSTLPSGFIGVLDDNDAGTDCYICWTTGTDGEWFYTKGTKAA